MNTSTDTIKKKKQKRKKSVSFKNIKPKQKIESKQAIKPITQILNQPNTPQKSILKTTRKISQPKRFTEKQIVEILGILMKLNKLENYVVVIKNAVPKKLCKKALQELKEAD